MTEWEELSAVFTHARENLKPIAVPAYLNVQGHMPKRKGECPRGANWQCFQCPLYSQYYPNPKAGMDIIACSSIQRQDLSVRPVHIEESLVGYALFIDEIEFSVVPSVYPSQRDLFDQLHVYLFKAAQNRLD